MYFSGLDFVRVNDVISAEMMRRWVALSFVATPEHLRASSVQLYRVT
jgi:hypothetical protein